MLVRGRVIVRHLRAIRHKSDNASSFFYRGLLAPKDHAATGGQRKMGKTRVKDISMSLISGSIPFGLTYFRTSIVLQRMPRALSDRRIWLTNRRLPLLAISVRNCRVRVSWPHNSMHIAGNGCVHVVLSSMTVCHPHGVGLLHRDVWACIATLNVS